MSAKRRWSVSSRGPGSRGFRRTSSCGEGSPGQSVIEAADAEGADVIVVGSHARGRLGRILLGSVSAHVVDHAGQPVVVIGPENRLDDAWPIKRTDS